MGKIGVDSHWIKFEDIQNQDPDFIVFIPCGFDLNKTKDALLRADDNYRIANKKAQDVTIKKLTKNNPTMAQKFNDNKI